ncbi:Uncharacterized protein dnm_084160 [Desulfonema magnum]|uniref:Uncharacterized protein n=1 Tax=Desulfonema magnum TaxID=45655 RepID=A0A975GTN9_9BACT|nr:Uncharacterized protein dnm_084160 [Desulfonema magnum]
MCHSCESRNPFFTDFTNPEAVDSCFRRNDKKNLNIKFKDCYLSGGSDAAKFLRI